MSGEKYISLSRLGSKFVLNYMQQLDLLCIWFVNKVLQPFQIVYRIANIARTSMLLEVEDFITSLMSRNSVITLSTYFLQIILVTPLYDLSC